MMIILKEKKKIEKGKLSIAKSDQKETDTIVIDKISHIGFAVDIGTTTVVVSGVLFFRNECTPISLGECTEENAQTKLGKDVMMRVMHAISGKQKILQELIVTQIERMAEKMVSDVFVTADWYEKIDIEFVVVGNTTMCHLFLGKSVEGLKGSPFLPAYSGNYMSTGKETGFSVFSEAKVFVLSGIASHVGSDALSVFCQSGMADTKDNTLLIDLGTNAEILLNASGKCFCCSAAAGPAFEGKGISCGKIAGEGVMTGMKVAMHTGNIILEYIPGKKLYGICGSGLIDILAELRKTGILEKDGYLLSKAEMKSCDTCKFYLQNLEEEKEKKFVFSAGNNGSVFVTQGDIRNLQLAKGAIAAAIKLLLKNADLSIDQIDRIILSGVLGSSIRLGNAKRIGLIPNIPDKKYVFIGNGALDGAITLLKKPALRKNWEASAKKIKHLELAEEKSFQDYFIHSMELIEN